jgi:hypothetical protein
MLVHVHMRQTDRQKERQSFSAFQYLTGIIFGIICCLSGIILFQQVDLELTSSVT